jgi:hypothetical protein
MMGRCKSKAVLCVLILTLLPAVVSAQEDQGGNKWQRSDFVSDASFIVATYRPEFGKHTAEAMTSAAKAFVDSLTDAQRTRAALKLDDPERHEWTNLPPQPNAGGLRLGDMSESQIRAVCDLMATLFSKTGYDKFVEIMLGDDQLLAGGPRPGIGTVDFAVMVFGKPSTTDTWAFQLDGHHLGINVTVDGDNVCLSPSFVGAQPEVFKIAEKEFRPFGGELDDAYALIQLLSDPQRKAAVIAPNRGNLRFGPGQDGNVPKPRGTPCQEFTQAQRDALMKLIGNWVHCLPEELAKARMEELERELDAMHFEWNGETNPRSDMSYAIYGPTLVIEFACQGRGEQALDHLHSMYRNPKNEYGAKAN